MARGWDWDGYRKFCVIRNPYDRVVSLYHHRFDHLKESPVSFKQFVFLLNPENRLHTTLKDFICDDKGQFLVRDILQFEYLAKQLPDYLKQAGIDLPSDSLPHLNASKSRRLYRDYYDAESEARVSMLYQYEIKRFGYAF